MKYQREIDYVTSLMDADLLGLLEDNDCIIAGGALTSVFTNKPVNDIDVYFRSKEGFSNVMREVIGPHHWEDDSINFSSAIVTHYTSKSILLRSNDQDVQFIAYKFFETPEEIFNDFDFTINMAALELKTKNLTVYSEFLKHNAQRYLGFNEGTRYPLVSALRVHKYKERGYDISKAQFLKLCLAINAKNIDSWEVLMDELGSFYGLKPDEIFDTTKGFSLQSAMDQLEAIYSIPNKMYKNLPIDWNSIYKEFNGKWDDITVEWMENRELKEKTRLGYEYEVKQSFKKYIENKESKIATANGLFADLNLKNVL